MNIDATAREVAAPLADRPSAEVDYERRELQARVDVLRQAGALPAPHDGDVPASVAQWTNWSNG